MHRLSTLPLIAVLLVLLATPRAALACPSCAEAVPSGSGTEDDDQARLARAYNHSIYLMIVVPYGALGFVGVMVYRHLRVRGRMQQELLDSMRNVSPDESTSPLSGDRACSPPSPDETS
jgi:hypothetical protein